MPPSFGSVFPLKLSFPKVIIVNSAKGERNDNFGATGFSTAFVTISHIERSAMKSRYLMIEPTDFSTAFEMTIKREIDFSTMIEMTMKQETNSFMSATLDLINEILLQLYF